MNVFIRVDRMGPNQFVATKGQNGEVVGAFTRDDIAEMAKEDAPVGLISNQIMNAELHLVRCHVPKLGMWVFINSEYL